MAVRLGFALLWHHKFVCIKKIHWYTFLQIVHMGFVDGLIPVLIVLDLLEVVSVVVGQL